MQGKVEALGSDAQKKAIKLKVEGLSNSAIADELNKEFFSELTTEQVKTFIARKNTQVFQISKEDKNFREKMAKTYWDTVQQLRDLNVEMIAFFQDLKDNPDFSVKKFVCRGCQKENSVEIPNYSTTLKAADVILRQIKHADDVIKRLQENNLNITINMVDATQKIVKIMPTIFAIAEKRGIIKRYNKKKLKEFQSSSNIPL